MKITMAEFIAKYCADIKQRSEARKNLIDMEDLPHDEIITDESGQKIPIVLCCGKEIPVMDIITSTEEDFARLYPDMECREMYRMYIEALTILDGEEAVNHIRNTMSREQERVKAFSEDNELSQMLW